jgi:hypothetical protein
MARDDLATTVTRIRRGLQLGACESARRSGPGSRQVTRRCKSLSPLTGRLSPWAATVSNLAGPSLDSLVFLCLTCTDPALSQVSFAKECSDLHSRNPDWKIVFHLEHHLARLQCCGENIYLFSSAENERPGIRFTSNYYYLPKWVVDHEKLILKQGKR